MKTNFFVHQMYVECPSSSRLGMACDGRNVITMINAGANSYNNDT